MRTTQRKRKAEHLPAKADAGRSAPEEKQEVGHYMINIICCSISLLISAFAVVYGACHLMKKGSPLYFQLLICAIACYSLQELFSLVNILCIGPDYSLNIGIMGILGTNCFMLSANCDQMDSLVDDRSEKNSRAKRLAFLAPAILLAGAVVFVLLLWDKSPASGVLFVVLSVPGYIASYYNLKHLILPGDTLGLLNATRWCNISMLLYYFASLLYMIALGLGLNAVTCLCGVLLSAVLFLLAVSARKGAERWVI